MKIGPEKSLVAQFTIYNLISVVYPAKESNKTRKTKLCEMSFDTRPFINMPTFSDTRVTTPRAIHLDFNIIRIGISRVKVKNPDPIIVLKNLPQYANLCN